MDFYLFLLKISVVLDLNQSIVCENNYNMAFLFCFLLTYSYLCGVIIK